MAFPSRRNRYHRCGQIGSAVFMVILLASHTAFSQPDQETRAEYPAVYTGQIIPTADPAEKFTAAAHLLTLPPTLFLQTAIPATRYMTLMGWIGSGPWPPFIYGSAAVRFHILRPSFARWGIALQPQLIGITSAVNKEWMDANLSTSLQGVVSSPLRPWRVHFGAALHTMPGTESYYEDGIFTREDYDFSNPQVSILARAEVTLKNKKTTFFTEGLWLAAGTKDKDDMFVVGLVGVRFRFGTTWLSISTGIVYSGDRIRISDVGGWQVLPMPPLLSVIVRI